MHIGFRTSGGRGEYEVVGSHTGLNPLDLEGWTFSMRWPDGKVRDTGLWLDPAASGKARLRSMLTPPIQIGKIVASMLLLPDPARTYKTTPTSQPIVRAKQYSVTEIGFGSESEFTGVADLVTFVPSFVSVANQGGRHDIGVPARWSRISAVYDAVDQLPDALKVLVTAHKGLLNSGAPISQQLTATVTNICKQLVFLPASGYVADSDPLPALERLLSITPSDGPTLPPPNELGEDEPEISARSASEWRMAKIRGAAGRKFGEQVRAAYFNRCAFCGGKFGGIDGIRSGIDAAHILAWSKHDLDIVCNGIGLCKLHHWAFDAGILMPVKQGDNYFVRYTTFAERVDPSSMAKLGPDHLQIPEEWLPADPAQRPSKKYLQQLYADLGVIFAEADLSAV